MIIIRFDGCLLLFDEYLLEHKLPDTIHFDNRINMTQLPVRSVSNLKLSITCALTLPQHNNDTTYLWCGSTNEVILAMTVSLSCINHCDKLMTRTYVETTAKDTISHMCYMIKDTNKFVWALSDPGHVLYLWDADELKLLATSRCHEFTMDKGISLILYT